MKPPREFDAFTNLVDRVLAVPHSVIQKQNIGNEQTRIGESAGQSLNFFGFFPRMKRVQSKFTGFRV
jgi:hypothetical protein